jgi:hypothetical protein
MSNQKRRSGKFRPRPKSNPKKKDFNKKDDLKSKDSTFLPEISLDLAKLPSKGLDYPKSAKIKYRPYSWGEVKEITQSKMNNKDQFYHIMKGVEVENMDKNDITLGDAIYIAIYRKFSTVGNTKITVQYHCKGCGKKTKGVFNLQEVGAEFMRAPALPMKIDIGGKEFAFRPLTITDYFNLEDKLKENDKLDRDFALMSMMCDAEFEEVYEALYNITTQDEMEDIKLIDHYLNHGLKKVQNKCKNVLDKKEDESGNVENILCGHVSDIELDGGQALLLPFREDEKRPKDRVRFGDET